MQKYRRPIYIRILKVDTWDTMFGICTGPMIG